MAKTAAVKKFDRLALEGLKRLREHRYSLLRKMIRIDVPFPGIKTQLDLCRAVEVRISAARRS